MNLKYCFTVGKTSQLQCVLRNVALHCSHIRPCAWVLRAAAREQNTQYTVIHCTNSYHHLTAWLTGTIHSSMCVCSDTDSQCVAQTKFAAFTNVSTIYTCNTVPFKLETVVARHWKVTYIIWQTRVKFVFEKCKTFTFPEPQARHINWSHQVHFKSELTAKSEASRITKTPAITSNISAMLCWQNLHVCKGFRGIYSGAVCHQHHSNSNSKHECDKSIRYAKKLSNSLNSIKVLHSSHHSRSDHLEDTAVWVTSEANHNKSHHHLPSPLSIT